jgi:hypothetical protein
MPFPWIDLYGYPYTINVSAREWPELYTGPGEVRVLETTFRLVAAMSDKFLQYELEGVHEEANRRPLWPQCEVLPPGEELDVGPTPGSVLTAVLPVSTAKSSLRLRSVRHRELNVGHSEPVPRGVFVVHSGWQPTTIEESNETRVFWRVTVPGVNDWEDDHSTAIQIQKQNPKIEALVQKRLEPVAKLWKEFERTGKNPFTK